jgi:hypothetical protein
MAAPTTKDELYNTLTQGELLSSHFGDFTLDKINALLGEAKSILKERDAHPTQAKKAYNILVECLENIHKHSAKLQPQQPAMFVMTNVELGVSISIGNLLPQADVEPLRTRLQNINEMDREQQKSSYREQIKMGEISARGGAGLGLLDIAIKSRNPLKFEFYDHSEDAAIFMLQAIIK